MDIKNVRHIISDSISKRKRKYSDRRTDSSGEHNRVSITKTYLRIRRTYNQISKEKRISLSNKHSRSRRGIGRMILSRTKDTRNIKEIRNDHKK